MVRGDGSHGRVALLQETPSDGSCLWFIHRQPFQKFDAGHSRPLNNAPQRSRKDQFLSLVGEPGSPRSAA